MEIPRFPRTIDIPDVENFLRSRLGQTVVMWPDQVIPLLGYMCYPQDAEAGAKLALTLWRWPGGSKEKPPEIPAALGRIQKDWLRVADIRSTMMVVKRGGRWENRVLMKPCATAR